MIGCKRCGECCRWHVFFFDGYNNDTEFMEVVGGKIVDEFALVPAPCRQLDGNNCRLYPNHPLYCRNFPPSDERWIRALGCRYFEDK